MGYLKSDVACLSLVIAAFGTNVSAQENPETGPSENTTAPAAAESSVDALDILTTEVAPKPEVAGAAEGAAQPAAAAAAPRRSSSRMVEEIIVTAQKREENVQDVPITIQAFSEGMLDAMGVQTTQDLQLITPSLNYGEFVGYSIIFMRGVGTDAFLTADPSIATYVDGVYLPFSFGQTSDFGSIERVEVLKGPQGTLFGRNAVGGAIAVYTADPDTEEATLDLSQSYARFNDAVTKVTANIPITDNFAVSVSGNYHRNDLYYHGIYGTDPSSEVGPREYGPEISRGFRVKALWRPTEEIDVMGAFAYNDFNGYSTSITPNTQPTIIAQAALALTAPNYNYPPRDYEANLNEAGLGYFSRLFYGRIGYHPGPIDIKLSGSHQYTGNYQFYDFDGSMARLAEFDSAQGDGSGVEATTAELQLTSNGETPFSDVFQWVAGAYYFDSQAGFRKPATLYLNIVDPVTNLIQNLASTPLFQNFTLLRNILQQAPTGRIGFTSGVATNSVSGYAQGTLRVTDWASLTLGGRYQVEKRVANESGTWLEQHDGSFINLIDRAEQSSTTESFSPKVSLEFRPTDGLMIYTSYQEATKSGTYNTVNIYDAIDYVEPETMKAYEIGAKTDLIEGLRFNIAAWYYEQKDLQTQFVSLLKGGAVSFETAGAARSKGVEFDMNWLLVPSLVDDLVFVASGAYVDAIYTDYDDASGFNQVTGLLAVNQDFTGNRVPQAAKFTGSIQLNKTFQVPSLSSTIELGGDVYYNSGFYWTAQNTEKSKQEAYDTLGAHVSWFHEPSETRVTVFGTNLLDERYNRQEFTVDFGVFQYQAAPIEYGIRIEKSF